MVGVGPEIFAKVVQQSISDYNTENCSNTDEMQGAEREGGHGNECLFHIPAIVRASYGKNTKRHACPPSCKGLKKHYLLTVKQRPPGGSRYQKCSKSVSLRLSVHTRASRNDRN